MTMATTALEDDSDLDLARPVERNPGVLLMTHRPLLITYMNGPARAMIHRLHRMECGAGRTGLPSVIMDFCMDLLEAVDHECDLDIVPSIQLDRDIDAAGVRLSLCGLGLPRSSEVDRPCICVLMKATISEWSRSSSD